jgi:hypothetical protein
MRMTPSCGHRSPPNKSLKSWQSTRVPVRSSGTIPAKDAPPRTSRQHLGTFGGLRLARRAGPRLLLAALASRAHNPSGPARFCRRASRHSRGNYDCSRPLGWLHVDPSSPKGRDE